MQVSVIENPATLSSLSSSCSANSFVSEIIQEAMKVSAETGTTSGLMAWNCGLLLGLVDSLSGSQGRLI